MSDRDIINALENEFDSHPQISNVARGNKEVNKRSHPRNQRSFGEELIMVDEKRAIHNAKRRRSSEKRQ